MEFVSIVKIGDEIKEMFEGYDPDVLGWMDDNGLEDGSRVAWLYEDEGFEGEIMVAGEDPIQTPVVWLKTEDEDLLPICEVDFVVLLKEKNQKEKK